MQLTVADYARIRGVSPAIIEWMVIEISEVWRSALRYAALLDTGPLLINGPCDT